MIDRPRKLTDGEIADFSTRHNIPAGAVGQYGIMFRDRGRFIIVGRNGDSLFYLEMPPTALPSYQDMAEGEQRRMEPTKGTPQEASTAAIIMGAIEHPVFDPELGGQKLGEFIDSVVTSIGAVASPLSEGALKGLWAVRLFGVPVVLWAGAGAVGYVAFQVNFAKKLAKAVRG